MKTTIAAVAMLLAACGGSAPPAPAELQPAPLAAASWSVEAPDVACPGASVRHDYTSTGVHVIFCTWACGTYTGTMPHTPSADRAIVTLEIGQMPSGWELLSEDVQPEGRCP